MTACATCGVYDCRTGVMETAPSHCPMKQHPDVVDTRTIYTDPAVREMARVAALVESTGYCKWTRVEETMQFARRMGIKKLGVAYCVGLRREVRSLHKVLRANGFEVSSACCKTGSIPKAHIGISDAEQVTPGSFEAMCNPVGQAKLMNEAGTGLNILFGLCVGHDSLFIKYSDSPVTCLVTKDRVLAHNPIGALNCSEGYYNEALYTRHSDPEAEA
ncbi:MAG TPA: DUF1847 domain-containing protein [Chloroflexota bacterium]|nr:DUF1847 domain-containing protein [Chloroflexota bacterium]